MTELLDEFVLKLAERHGRLNVLFPDRDTAIIKEIAKKFLNLGRSVEEVAEATGLPLETVKELI